jgi:hypothetical protein
LITSGTLGSVLYINPGGTLSQLPIGAAGKVIASIGGLPTYVSTTGTLNYYDENPTPPAVVPVATNAASVVAIGDGAITNGVGAFSIGNGAVASGTSNIALGSGASVTGSGGIGFGANTTSISTSTVAIGSAANAADVSAMSFGASSNAIGQYSLAIGDSATSGVLNGIAIGRGAESNDESAIAIGSNSFSPSESAVVIGTGASVGVTSDFAVVIGSGANSNGESSVTLGDGATTADDDAIAIGSDSETFGVEAIAIGKQAKANTSSVSIGATAGTSVTTATQNVAVGQGALAGTTEGSQNVGVGISALNNNTLGSTNTAVGALAATGNTIGTQNVAVGAASLASNQTGSDNTAIGVSALSITTGSANTAIGQGAGDNNTTGTQNTFLGDLAGASSTATVSGSTCIGYNSNVTLSNQIAFTDAATVYRIRGEDYTMPAADGAANEFLGTDGSGTLSWGHDSTKLSLSGGTMTGNITLGENASIALDPAGSADGKYTGTTITGTAGATLVFGDLVYLAVADSRWELVDADSVTTAGAVLTGMCVLAAAADGNATNILLNGVIRADAKFPALTIGAPVYASTTAGSIQVAQPSGTDDVIQVVGFALTADEIYFNPSQDYITHV